MNVLSSVLHSSQMILFDKDRDTLFQIPSVSPSNLAVLLAPQLNPCPKSVPVIANVGSALLLETKIKAVNKVALERERSSQIN